MISESSIKFRQAVGKLCTIPFRESAHSPTSTLLLTNAAAFSAIFSHTILIRNIVDADGWARTNAYVPGSQYSQKPQLPQSVTREDSRVAEMMFWNTESGFFIGQKVWMG